MIVLQFEGLIDRVNQLGKTNLRLKSMENVIFFFKQHWEKLVYS